MTAICGPNKSQPSGSKLCLPLFREFLRRCAIIQFYSCVPSSGLFVCTKFGTSDDDRYLTNELADALALEGELVQVVALQWSAPPGVPPQAFRQSNGVEVLIVSPRQVKHLGWRLAPSGSVRLSLPWQKSGAPGRS